MNRRLSRLIATWAFALASPAAVVACSAGGTNPDGPTSCPTLVTPDVCPVAAPDGGTDAQGPPSWKKDVEPLFVKYCNPCHTAGGIGQGTKDFSTFEAIQNASSTIGTQVSGCAMPQPGNAQPTATERETIITWALVCRAPDN